MIVFNVVLRQTKQIVVVNNDSFFGCTTHVFYDNYDDISYVTM